MKKNILFFFVSLFFFISNVYASEWQTEEKLSPMDDSKEFYMWKTRDGYGSAYDKKELLVFSCSNNEINAYITFEGNVLPFSSGGSYEIRYRIDKEPAIKTMAQRGEKYTSLFFDKPTAFIQSMVGKKTFIIEYPAIGGAHMVQFDLDGMEEPLEKLSQTCKWKK